MNDVVMEWMMWQCGDDHQIAIAIMRVRCNIATFVSCFQLVLVPR